MKTIYIVFFITLLIFFPLKITINGIFVGEHKKLYCDVNLYGFIKIKSFYIRFYASKLVAHITKNIAIIYPYKKILNRKSILKFYKDIHVKNLYILTDIGLKNEISNTISASIIINFMFNIVSAILINNKPHVKLKNIINIREETDVINSYIKLKFYTNIFVIIINLTKIILEKILNGKTKKFAKQ